jgi:E3 ubiquitin-protein ligase synoviolin
MKFSTYFTASIGAMIGMVYYAYYTQRQFYPSVLFLVSSKASYIVMGNMLVAVSLLLARIFKTIFFGQLRDSEVELLIDAAKYAIPETCLALTIFRDELTPPMIGLFGGFIFIKLLHKLTKCRVEYCEQLLPTPLRSQLRIYLLLISVAAIDIAGLATSMMYISVHGRSAIILFGFEFGLLLVYMLNLTVRFIIQIVDSLSEQEITSKGLYLMLVDMVCEIIKLLTYLAFFGLVFVYYGLPIHILRDVWMAYTSCHRKVVGFVKYLQLTRNLDSRFLDATPEELASAGNCLVCREELLRGKKLRCGHVFHLDCLRMWLQHQQSCPLCRANIAIDNALDGGDAAAAREAAPAAAAPAPAHAHAHGHAHAAGEVAQVGAAVGESGGKGCIFGIPLTAEFLRNPPAYPRFCIVAAEPDVAVHSDPVQTAGEVRKVKAVGCGFYCMLYVVCCMLYI